jgi:hypothetical protein
VQKEIGYDPGCEHPHFPSAGTKTASFALVWFQGVLIRLHYYCYVCTMCRPTHYYVLIIHQVCMQHRNPTSTPDFSTHRPSEPYMYQYTHMYDTKYM